MLSKVFNLQTNFFLKCSGLCRTQHYDHVYKGFFCQTLVINRHAFILEVKNSAAYKHDLILIQVKNIVRCVLQQRSQSVLGWLEWMDGQTDGRIDGSSYLAEKVTYFLCRVVVF